MRKGPSVDVTDAGWRPNFRCAFLTGAANINLAYAAARRDDCEELSCNHRGEFKPHMHEVPGEVRLRLAYTETNARELLLGKDLVPLNIIEIHPTRSDVVRWVSDLAFEIDPIALDLGYFRCAIIDCYHSANHC